MKEKKRSRTRMIMKSTDEGVNAAGSAISRIPRPMLGIA
jgi:hypothetical protein